MTDRKELTRKYKETPRRAGIFRVRNLKSGRSLVGATVDLPSMLNRQRFQLESGGHADKQLQADWDAEGADAFAIEILDELAPRDEPGYDPSNDLEVLKELWIDRLRSAGETLYNAEPPFGPVS